jgi:predicted negative regulator of RcsB-dependent stress response
VDNETKQLIKQPDHFVTATERGIEWAQQNRQTAIIYATTAVALILILVGGYAIYQHRTNSAATAFGSAMQIYQTPIANPAQPLPPGMKSYNSEAERAKAANAQFLAVADQYGMTRPGKLAQYFAGLTYMEEGQNASAEDTLKKVSSSWNGDISALGKLGLAQLYQQTGRNSQAADIYNDLGKGHANTVPPYLAQIQLGEMYSAEGQTAKAREVYAKIKDSDKDPKGNPGPAAQLATEKLNPTPAAAGGPALQ